MSTLFVFWRGYGLGQRFSSPPSGLWRGVCDATDRTARETGGLWARSDPGDTYHKILLLFGAPRARGDDVDQALACAIHLNRSFSNLRKRYPRLRWGIGLTTAIVYTGYVGGPDRHEFTAMGDGVNLAARLAARASQGVVLTDETTRRQARRGLFQAGPTLRLKGISQPVTTHRLVGHAPSPVGDVHRDVVEHPEALRSAIQSWNDMPRPVLQLTVAPDADARKFLEQLLAGLHLSGDEVGRIRFRPADAAHPHGGLRRFLNALFGTAPEGETRTGGETSAPPGLPESLRPIFGRDKSLARLMDRLGVGAWTDRIAGAVSDTLPAVLALSERPVWVLDEAQYLSDIDREVFRKLEFRRRRDLRVIVVTRDVSSPDTGGDTQTIHLGTVSIQELLEIAGPLLPEGKVPSRLLQYLHEKSGGMARLGCLYIDHLRANGLLTPPRTRAGMWRVHDLESARLPDTMRAHFQAAIDRLPHTSAVLAQALAVAGDGTTRDVLQSYGPAGMDSAGLADALTPLIESGLIETQDEGHNASLGFTDPACRQAVYETMSFAARESLHAQAARYWRARGAAGAETAGEHLFLARDRTALALLTSAGRRAHKLWLLGRARRFLRWGLLVLANRFDPSYGRIVPPLPRQLTEGHRALLEPLADVFQAQGLYREARTIYRRLASDAAGRGAPVVAGVRRLAAARMLWYAGRYVQTLTEARAVMKAAHGRNMLMVKGEAGFLLGETYRRTGRMKEAASPLSESLRVRRLPGERNCSSAVLNALGLVQWNCGRLDQARRSFTAAMRLLPRSGSIAKRGQIANNLGILLEDGFWDEMEDAGIDEVAIQWLALLDDQGGEQTRYPQIEDTHPRGLAAVGGKPVQRTPVAAYAPDHNLYEGLLF
ncbi:MAG: hypothetical protein IIA44_08065, partial [Acidobacteria bacterium]|nr:hypothetical protein [Acidobacteriota bacterium]